MRYVALILSFVLMSCIKVTTSNLNVYELDQAVEEKAHARQSTGFWAAMKQLDFQYAEQFADSSEEYQFSRAMTSIMDGDYELAPMILENLVNSSQDSLMVKHSGTVLTGIYFLSNDWDALLELDGRLPGGLDDMNTVSLIAAWGRLADEVIQYPENPFTIPMKKSISGVPMVEVIVNGVTQTFWIDTGAELTVLASDIAQECGVEPLVEMTSKVGTSTDKQVELWPGVIDELKIEGLVFNNHPVFIINKEDLEFKILKIFTLLKVDGIIGWNAIQNLNLKLDYGQNLVTFEKPVPDDKGDRNFHFLTQPFVSVSDTNGVPFKFFMDTGANTTSLHEPAFAFFDTSTAESSNAVVGGAGGMQKVSQLTLKNQSLILGNTRMDFPTINGKSAMGDTEEGFILYDGILGSDIAKEGVLTLDFQNGRIELTPGMLKE